MSTYQKKLKRSKNGIVRYVGRSLAGHQEKFYLGWDLQVAEQREALIRELWDHLERHWDYTLGNYYWPPDYLAAAKAIAKGKTPVLPPTFRMKSDPAKYVAALNDIGPAFAPADEVLFEDGLKAVSEGIRERRDILSTRNNVELTGQTIEEALNGYRDYLQTKGRQPDGSYATWWKTQLTQLKSWRSFLDVVHRFKDGEQVKVEMTKVDLGHLTTEHAQAMIDAVRSRPLTFDSLRRKDGTRTRLTPSSARGIIKVAVKFFEWLDLSSEFSWLEPRKFRLTRKPEPLTNEEKFVREQKKEVSTVTYEHIRLLSKYALPSERVILLCGLNAAFGPGEIGQLRVPFIRRESGEIVGIRFKTGNPTRHKLWPETLEGLEWQLDRRASFEHGEGTDREIVFLTESGKPLWRITKAGNYSDGVSRQWNRLVNRVQKDHPDFPDYSLGKLRKTAATRILMLAGAAEASLVLAHRTISEDELLECYVQIPWEKLYDAQERFGEEVAPHLKTDRPAFLRQSKNYIGLKKIELIRELHTAGVPVKKIAKAAKVSTMTVYRQIERFNDEQRSYGQC